MGIFMLPRLRDEVPCHVAETGEDSEAEDYPYNTQANASGHDAAKGDARFVHPHIMLGKQVRGGFVWVRP